MINVVYIGLLMIVFGEFEDIIYIYFVVFLIYIVGDVLVEGEFLLVIGVQIDGDIIVFGMIGFVKIVIEGLIFIEQDVCYDGLFYDICFVVLEDEGSFVIVVIIEDLCV